MRCWRSSAWLQDRARADLVADPHRAVADPPALGRADEPVAILAEALVGELRLGAAAHVMRADRARARRFVSGDLDPVYTEQVLGRAAPAEHAMDELADL